VTHAAISTEGAEVRRNRIYKSVTVIYPREVAQGLKHSSEPRLKLD